MNENLKAISIRQPWATLIVGYSHFSELWIPTNYRKDIENRDWKYIPSHRGQILIHAAKTYDLDGFYVALRILRNLGYTGSEEFLYKETQIRGAYIGRVVLNDVVTDSPSPWFFGKLGFKLRNPKPIVPIYGKGQLGIFDSGLELHNTETIKKDPYEPKILQG